METISKILFGFAVLLVCFLASCAASALSPEDAAKHGGEMATVEGKVFSVFVSKRGNTFMNIGGDYPNQPFTAVMLGRTGSMELLSTAKSYDGKSVAVTGLIQLYKGKPEIVVTSKNQIRIMDR